jgi:hypothetical protein
MGAGTILLIALAVLIIFIMFKVADGAHGPADVAPLAGRSADTGREPPLVGAKTDGVDDGSAAGRSAHGGRHECR